MTSVQHVTYIVLPVLVTLFVLFVLYCPWAMQTASNLLYQVLIVTLVSRAVGQDSYDIIKSDTIFAVNKTDPFKFLSMLLTI